MWYKQAAWRLGVILFISPKPGIDAVSRPPTDEDYQFTLAPLGHLLLPQATVVKECHDMRPFLTFSVPNPGLEDLKDKSFDAVDWQGQITMRCTKETDPQKRVYNQQVICLEASKLGARAINDAYSTFNFLGETTTANGAFRLYHYEGVYLGAEMIRIGDPIRVTVRSSVIADSSVAATEAIIAATVPPDATVVMLIDSIEVLFPAAPPHRWYLQFRGSLYRPYRRSMSEPVPSNAVLQPASLGQVFSEEMAMRNQIEPRARTGMEWVWLRLGTDGPGPAQAVVRAEQDVLGRFYVTTRLMEVIDPNKLKDWVARGAVEEAPAYLNNRGHSGGGQLTGRKPSRTATLGESVSTTFVAPSGIIEN